MLVINNTRSATLDRVMNEKGIASIVEVDSRKAVIAELAKGTPGKGSRNVSTRKSEDKVIDNGRGGQRTQRFPADTSSQEPPQAFP